MESIAEATKLSDRERTVLLLAADGLTDKEIASNLGLSLKTVHTYWDRMRQKFSASTRTQVFAKFLRIESGPNDAKDSFQRLFATWEEGVWILNQQNETIYANSRIAETFGYSESEFTGKTPKEIFEAAGAKELYEFVKASRSESQSRQTLVKTAKGEKIWLRIDASPFCDARGKTKAVVLLVHNITLQKRVEHALTSCETVLKDLTDTSSDCICKFDSALNCIYANPSFLAFSKARKDRCVGKHISELEAFFAPNKVWVASLTKALETGKKQKFTQSQSEGGAIVTWLLPEPSADFLPSSIISVTRCLPELEDQLLS